MSDAPTQPAGFEPDRPPSLSMSRQLMIAGILLVIIPLIAAALLLNDHVNQSLEQEAERSMAVQARSLQGSLSQLANDRASDALLAASSSAIFDSSASISERRAILTDYGIAWGYPVDIVAIDPDGDVLLGYEQPVEYENLFETQHFQQAAELEEGRAFIGDVGPDPITGQTVINVSAPSFSENGDLLGVVRIAWPVSDFNAFLGTLAGEGGLDISVYDANGVVVGSSGVAIAANETPGASAAAERAIQDETGVMRGAIATQGSGTEEHFIAFAPLEQSDRAIVDWSLTAASPASVVFEPVGDRQPLIVAVLLAVIALAIAAVVLLARKFMGPVGKMASAASAVSAGDFDARADLAGPAEIRTTASAFNQVLDERSDLIQAREERDAIRLEVSRLLDEVSDAAGGDLTIEARPGSLRDEAIDSLAASFNSMVRQLRSVVSEVNETTAAVASASTGIAETSTDLARISAENSRRIGETAAELDELAASIRNGNARAVASSEAAAGIRNRSEETARTIGEITASIDAIRDQIQRADESISQLGERSGEIGRTAETVESVARQANTLALNATIQAAKSGTAGRALTAVACDIHRLAERAAAAASLVEDMAGTFRNETRSAATAIDAGSAQATGGLEFAGRATSQLAAIDAALGQISEMLGSITRTSDANARTASGLAATMQSISEETLSATNTTKEAAESVNILAGIAERLRESVAAFRVGDEPRPSAAPADGD